MEEAEVTNSTELEIPEKNPIKDHSPKSPPKEKDWSEVKESQSLSKREISPDSNKKCLSKLDLVRAKLAVATKGKDGLGRHLLFKSG